MLMSGSSAYWLYDKHILCAFLQPYIKCALISIVATEEKIKGLRN